LHFLSHSLSLSTLLPFGLLFCFFINSASTVIYTLSLHDALPISLLGYNQEYRKEESIFSRQNGLYSPSLPNPGLAHGEKLIQTGDRKSTRLNSSHVKISYAVFCLKKKNIIHTCL